MAHIIDGKALAARVKDGIKTEIDGIIARGVVPGLAFILVGEDPASKLYVRNKKRVCGEVNIKSLDYNFPMTISESDLLDVIEKLNNNKDVHGILVQLPLPSRINTQTILASIDPNKDVDGFHPLNMGRLLIGQPGLRPCTPLGIMEMLGSIGADLKGKNAVMVGRSNIVGKPTAIMLLERHATVTLCHSRTNGLPDVVRSADVLVVAIGKAKFIKGDWIKKGAVVIDVGMNMTPEGKFVGDVDFDEAAKRAGWITPVPGGVGPMTIAMLLKNTVLACRGTGV